MASPTLTVGSLIMTSEGERCAEDLKPGDLIVTKYFGLQKLKYVAFKDVYFGAARNPWPIKVDCRHLGFEGVSYFAPDQKIFIRHPMFEIMFGASEVLARSGDLREMPGFEQVTDLSSLTYIALGFSQQQIISCNGGPISIGPTQEKSARISLGPEEAQLAIQLLEPKQPQAKRHSFPLH
jgi:hypothetical protein